MSAPLRFTPFAVDPLFLERWSPRAFDGTSITEDQLLTLFDAARWAPSAFNYQPWRFVYTQRDSAVWGEFLDLLLPFNQTWVKDAAALIFILSDTQIVAPGSTEAKPAGSNSFDAGAAWALLALQARRLGLHTHAMAGFDQARARSYFALADRYRIEAAIAVGHLGDPAQLPEPLQAREFPSDRLPVEAIAFAGNLPDDLGA